MGKASDLWLSSEVLPIEGRERAEPGDFEVEERLLYDPCGRGTHLYLRVEKVGISTFEAVRRLSRALGRQEREFGYAGLKDSHAVSYQTLSLEHADPLQVQGLELAGLRVLEVRRHRNKLKRGHLRGNRFRLRIRDPGPADLDRTRRVLAVLERRGVPNWFGQQRFGRHSTTPLLGRLLLAEDFEGFLEQLRGHDSMVRRALSMWASGKPAEVAVRALPRRFLSLCTSALQSLAFNEVLRERLATIDELWCGDLAYLHRNGAVFLVQDPELEAARVQSFEISPSGPLPGPAMRSPEGEQVELENEVYTRLEIDPSRFGLRRPYAQKGGRRALRVPLSEPRVEQLSGADGGQQDLELVFELPAGSYATVVLDELFKQPPVLASASVNTEGPSAG